MSKSSNKTFFERYTEGSALPDEVDNYIAEWHNSGDEVSCELHEYLGLTWSEYQAFVSDASVLPLILKARNDKKPLAKVIEFAIQNQSVAARAQNVATLHNWLRSRKKQSN